ncbi:MAG TPA: amino acid ABC transporter permease [Ktedonobacteraceae bacterium]|nr:amino acid ABC transporter permease [Ktedonobacteraceae bacterium]
MQQTFTESNIERKPRSWLGILDYVFYIVVVAALAGLALYFYHYRDFVSLYFPVFLGGAGLTIFLTISSMILATIFGFIGALGRLSRFAPFRIIAAIYVEVIRGTPILVQLLLWGFGIRSALGGIGFDPYTIAYNFMTLLQNNSILPPPNVFDAAFYGIIALSFNYGAYLTEVFRTGIESIPIGQTEAALSLGLNSRQIMRKIVLPQAFRITIPPFANYFITLVQDTALLSVVGGVLEIQQLVTAAATANASDSNLQLFFYVFGAVMFFCICYPLAILARYLESRFARAY